MKNSEVEALTEKAVKKIATEHFDCKGHDCYIANLGDIFGLSALVFKNGHHIFYANQYYLHYHHMYKEDEKLVQKYKKILNNILFSEDEILGKVGDYDDFSRKEHYIRNYLPQAYDHISMFCCGMTDEEERSRKYKISRWYKYYSSVAFGYFKDKDFVETENQYMAHLRDSYDQIKNDSDVFRKMIKYELYNHECGYTGEYNEALSAVGLEYSDLTENQKAILKEEFKKCCENTI